MRHLISKRKQFISIIVVCFCSYGLLGVMQSCTGSSTTTDARTWCMTKTDSLWLVLNETKKKFNFKMDEIAVRKIEMDSQLRIIKFPGSYVYSDPEKSIIDQYNSVYTFYRPIANKYKEVVLESESHFFELKALEKGVKAGKYDGNTKEFKLEYEELMKELLNGKEEAFEIAGKLNSVEPVYQRVVPKIDELLLQISEIQKK